jgi:hypothetical protein
MPAQGENIMIVREPHLETVKVHSLLPTQITVGFREVHEKRKHWRAQRHKLKFLSHHLVPVIQGPKDRYYIIDHHHLVRALHDEGVTEVAITVVADLRTLDKDTFWSYLDHHAWMHPYDEKGRRRHASSLPRSVAELVDDPFRSLAGQLRLMGGFAKDTVPFSEFLWADFLRRRIKKALVVERFNKALDEALVLAKSEVASYLPGWCGPVARS